MKRIKIGVGNGMATYKFCGKLIAKARPAQVELIVFGEEIHPVYDRVHLSEFFSGKKAEDLSMTGVDWYINNDITLLSNPAQLTDRTNKTIHSYKGMTDTCDYIVLATGSGAFVPSIPGAEKDVLFVYRTIEDLEMIRDDAPNAMLDRQVSKSSLGIQWV